MTSHATEFVQPRTFAVLSGHPVEVDQWGQPTAPGVDHVDLSHWADLLLVAPATANILAKMAAGIADDALTTYHLAHRRTVAVAPAMNTFMWRHPATREAVARLERGGGSPRGRNLLKVLWIGFGSKRIVRDIGISRYPGVWVFSYCFRMAAETRGIGVGIVRCGFYCC